MPVSEVVRGVRDETASQECLQCSLMLLVEGASLKLMGCMGPVITLSKLDTVRNGGMDAGHASNKVCCVEEIGVLRHLPHHWCPPKIEHKPPGDQASHSLIISNLNSNLVATESDWVEGG